MYGQHLNTIEKVQPLIEWNGGAVRIEPSNGQNPANCSDTRYYDLTFDVGTQELRSAVLTAIYTALATNKNIRFFIDDNQCSPAGVPIIRGAYIIR